MAKILIVEDETELAEVLEYNLRKEGYEVLTAFDGLSACRSIGAERPDLILLDILLPDLDGWEVCRLLRRHHDRELASTPVVMLTALDSLDDRLRGLELGADAYLSKPYALREVMLRVRQLLAKRRERSALMAEMKALRAGSELQADLQDLMFHELRNQMMIIGGFSGLLVRDVKSVPAADCLEAIQRSAEYLSSLAEGFLLVRRIESGAFELPREEVSLNAVLEEMVELYRTRAAAKQILLRLEAAGVPPLPLHAGAVRVILSSLLENAVKYSEDGSAVSLRLVTVHGGSEIEIEDQGPGVSEEEAERIFDRFYRGERLNAATRGSGLGLYVARTLARHLGGEISLRSAPGRGTCFTVHFSIPSAGSGCAEGGKMSAAPRHPRMPRKECDHVDE
jgi:signal transduction histidine kinase